jgi:hypothetical protein
MRKTIVLLLVAVMLLMASNLNAVEPFNAFWKSRQLRQEEAQKWLAGFRKLNLRIPMLSPEEQLWLKTEIDDEIARAGNQYTKRALAAMNSREFDLRIAKPHAEEITRVLSELSRPTLSDRRLEVILWAQLASILMDNEFWQAIDDLVQRGIIEKKINGVESNYSFTYTLWAKFIVDKIVVSYLTGNLDK